MEIPVNVITVAIAALITAIFTGLGAVPFFFVEQISDRWLGIANAMAAGLMFGASLGLVYEGVSYNLWRVAVGVLIGLVLIIAARRLIGDREEEFHLGAIEGADAIRMLLIVGVMTVHSFAEGIGVGVSYGGGAAFGTFIAIAIAVHNIPEGLAISLVLVPRGVSVWKAVGWSIFSSLPQPIMAIPAFLFVLTFRPFLPIGLGLAAGAMFYMVFTELLPEAFEAVPRSTAIGVLIATTLAMLGFQALIG